MIVPTRSRFVKDRAELRKEVFLKIASENLRRQLFDDGYPDYEDYLKFWNGQYNAFFENATDDISVQKSLFDGTNVSMLGRRGNGGSRSVPKAIRSIRTLPSVFSNDCRIAKKLGAALSRIILNDIIRKMGGLRDTSDYQSYYESYISRNMTIFARYKDVMLNMIYSVACFVQGGTTHGILVEDLRLKLYSMFDANKRRLESAVWWTRCST